MADRPKPTAKRRKSGESTSTDEYNPPPPQAQMPQYYSNSAHYVQYPPQGMYAYPPHPHHQYPPRVSPPSHVGSVGMPPPGYPRDVSRQSAHLLVPPQSHQYVSPDSRQFASSVAAFSSPPSSLRRRPYTAARGATKTPSKRLGKFIHLRQFVLSVAQSVQ